MSAARSREQVEVEWLARQMKEVESQVSLGAEFPREWTQHALAACFTLASLSPTGEFTCPPGRLSKVLVLAGGVPRDDIPLKQDAARTLHLLSLRGFIRCVKKANSRSSATWRWVGEGSPAAPAPTATQATSNTQGGSHGR